MRIIKPTLAATLKNPSLLTFPKLASPKLDGIRCLIVRGDDGKPKAVSRNMKPIPNEYVRDHLERVCPIGFDGELMITGQEFNGVTSGIMSHDGAPDFRYHVFDFDWGFGGAKPYHERYRDLQAYVKFHKKLMYRIVVVDQIRVDGPAGVDKLEAEWVEAGFEGLMLRDMDARYLHGRSSEKGATLIKVKRFEDSEAEIIDFEPLESNQNEATKDAFGYTTRSSHKAGKVEQNTLGALIVRDIHTGVEFKLGTGFSAAMRAAIWNNQPEFLGKFAKYKHQPSGRKDKPRFPVFIGFRHKNDL